MDLTDGVIYEILNSENDKEIESVKKLEKQNPELFKQLARYNEIQEKQYWKYLPKALLKEGTTFATTGVLTAGVLKGYTSLKGLVKAPLVRYAEAHTVNKEIDNIIIKDVNYEAKMKALEKYFSKQGKQRNRFYMSSKTYKVKIDPKSSKPIIHDIDSNIDNIVIERGATKTIATFDPKTGVIKSYEKYDTILYSTDKGLFIQYPGKGIKEIAGKGDTVNDLLDVVKQFRLNKIEVTGWRTKLYGKTMYYTQIYDKQGNLIIHELRNGKLILEKDVRRFLSIAEKPAQQAIF